MMRPLLAAALFVSLAVAAPSAAGEVRAAQASTAGTYIVVFKADAVRAASEASSQRPLVAAAAGNLARAHGGNVTYVYQHALEGFAVRLSSDRAAALAGDPRVAYVEPDQVVHATQTPATWGIDRIDQRDLPLNNTYNFNDTGAGVHAYIIDTGVRGTHQEFTGRMGNGADFVGDGKGTNDCHGHGTHVAGTTGGATYGVAKGYGTCLDIFAPGSSITSAWNTSDTATNTISGTSMATPHVAGVIALYLDANPGASPAAVTSALVMNSTTAMSRTPAPGLRTGCCTRSSVHPRRLRRLRHPRRRLHHRAQS